MASSAGCTSPSNTANTTVPPAHNTAWTTVNSRGTRNARARSARLGTLPASAQRSARSARRVPHQPPSTSAASTYTGAATVNTAIVRALGPGPGITTTIRPTTTAAPITLVTTSSTVSSTWTRIRSAGSD